MTSETWLIISAENTKNPTDPLRNNSKNKKFVKKGVGEGGWFILMIWAHRSEHIHFSKIIRLTTEKLKKLKESENQEKFKNSKEFTWGTIPLGENKS